MRVLPFRGLEKREKDGAKATPSVNVEQYAEQPLNP